MTKKQKKKKKAKKPFLKLGGPIDRIKVSLRVFSDDLDPDIISPILGCGPSMQREKGEIIVGRHSKHERVAPIGIWILESDLDEGVALEEQIIKLLARVNPNTEAWEELTRKYKVDLFCGLFLDEAFNRGFSLSPTLLQMIAERGIILDFDIYA